MNFSNHWLMLRLCLRSGNVKNCKQTITLVKEYKKIIKCKKKGILNFAYKQEILFKKFKEPKISKNIGLSKTR